MKKTNSKKIIFFPRYNRVGASSRYRVFNFIPYFESLGYKCTVVPLFDSEYLENRYSSRVAVLFSIIKAYAARIKWLLRLKDYNLAVIEYELFPFVPPIFELLFKFFSIKYIVDFDDAIFHRYDAHPILIVRLLFRNKIKCVMNNAHSVIVGNKYLYDYAISANSKRVYRLATVVDTDKYYQCITENSKDCVTICWIGSPSTSIYLYEVLDVFRMLSLKYKIKLTLLGSNKLSFDGVNVSYIKWSEESEVEELMKCDIGIMPLANDNWVKGKCGFKLVQYMAAGLPVVASPIGANNEIVDHGVNGFLPTNKDEWVEYLSILIESKELRRKFGVDGREKIVKNYSYTIANEIYKGILLKCAV